MMKSMKKQDKKKLRFELTLANGKTTQFKTGQDLHEWARNNTKWKFRNKNKKKDKN